MNLYTNEMDVLVYFYIKNSISVKEGWKGDAHCFVS